jgi:hypothetical protein
MFFVLKFELILIIGSNNVLKEGARKAYRGRRRVGQGCCTASVRVPGYRSRGPGSIPGDTRFSEKYGVHSAS